MNLVHTPTRGPKYHDDRPTGCRASKVASSQTVMPTLHTSLDVLPSDAKCIEVDLKEYIYTTRLDGLPKMGAPPNYQELDHVRIEN